MTFHSVSGLEWKSITNACIKNKLILVEYNWLTQKTFSPRQLARTKTVKGDVLITFQKNNNNNKDCIYYSDIEFKDVVIDKINNMLIPGDRDTNHILMELMKWVFEKRIIIGDIDVFDILKEEFNLNSKGLWNKQ